MKLNHKWIIQKKTCRKTFERVCIGFITLNLELLIPSPVTFCHKSWTSIKVYDTQFLTPKIVYKSLARKYINLEYTVTH